MNSADLLVEIGTEELPPKALRSLMQAFADNLRETIDEERLEHGDVHAYASPRRLAVIIESLSEGQPDRRVQQKGPPVKIAFDDDGTPRPPAEAFAKKCGVAVADLGRTQTEKGEWLSYELVECSRAEPGGDPPRRLEGIGGESGRSVQALLHRFAAGVSLCTCTSTPR